VTQPEQQMNRVYAVNLMNRADVAFDARDVTVAGAIVPLLEADMAEWLARELRGTVSREAILAAIRAGRHRPMLPQPIIEMRSNVR
jgi:hypothetical protein